VLGIHKNNIFHQITNTILNTKQTYFICDNVKFINHREQVGTMTDIFITVRGYKYLYLSLNTRVLVYCLLDTKNI